MTPTPTPMDPRLQLIAHLYEEEFEGLEPLDRLLEDPALREEYRQLQAARFALDHRERVRPDTAAIDAIVARAAGPASPRRWTDRAPLRLVRSRRLLAPTLAAAAVVLIAVAIFPWSTADRIGTPQLAAESEPSAAESLLRSLPPAAPSPVASAKALDEEAEMADLDVAEGVAPEWDDGERLRRLARRIEDLRATGPDAWGGPAVPLEMMPTDGGTSGLMPAGTRPPGQ